MASVGLKIARNLRLLSNFKGTGLNNTIQRTLFTPTALGVDGFKKQQQNSELALVNNIDSFKKRVTDGLTSDKPLFTEDLKTFLYLTRNDADLEMLVKLLKNFKKNSLSVSEFGFGAPFMRLLYSMNKTDDALKYFNDPELSHIFNDKSSLILLVNKLMEDKRYTDVIPLVLNSLENNQNFRDATTKKLRVPSDLVKLFCESLYHLNNKEAVEHAKKMIKLLKDNEIRLPGNALANVVLLAVNQNEFDLAFELTSLFEEKNNIGRNLKVISLAHIQRFTDAFEVINKILNSINLDGSPCEIFPLTIKSLREKIQASSDAQAKETLEGISKKIISSSRLATKDLTDITLRVVEMRMGLRNQQGGFKRDGFNRQDGYNRQGGFNRQGDSDRSEGFNRPPQDRPFVNQNRFGTNRNQNTPFGLNRQQGVQSVDGEERRFQPREPRQFGARFEQGQQQIGRPERSAPPRRQKIEDDE